MSVALVLGTLASVTIAALAVNAARRESPWQRCGLAYADALDAGRSAPAIGAVVAETAGRALTDRAHRHLPRSEARQVTEHAIAQLVAAIDNDEQPAPRQLRRWLVQVVHDRIDLLRLADHSARRAGRRNVKLGRAARITGTPRARTHWVEVRVPTGCTATRFKIRDCTCSRPGSAPHTVKP